MGGWHTYADFDLQSQWQSIDAYGYPANYGDNEELYVAHSTYAMNTLDCFNKSERVACKYQASCNPCHSGNSGGPWVAGSRVVGVNSYHEGGETATSEYSPYLGGAWKDICQSIGHCQVHQMNG